jgi:hypothetical protein
MCSYVQGLPPYNLTLSQNHCVCGLCSSFGILQMKGGNACSVGSLTAVLNHRGTQQFRSLPPLTLRRKQIQFPNRCVFQLFTIPEDGQSPLTP